MRLNELKDSLRSEGYRLISSQQQQDDNCELLFDKRTEQIVILVTPKKSFWVNRRGKSYPSKFDIAGYTVKRKRQ